MEQIERIKLMEQHLDKAAQAVKALSDALDLYSEAVDSIEAIDDYLASDEVWCAERGRHLGRGGHQPRTQLPDA